jgi:hypothetical protein
VRVRRNRVLTAEAHFSSTLPAHLNYCLLR